MSKNEKKFQILFVKIERLLLIIFFKNIYEAGIELLGPEVKSLRLGKGNISESLTR